MKTRENHSTRTKYNISLAVSGAALGGVYSAGVLDFLLQALREAEKAYDDRDIRAQPWEVNLTDLVGTSSGGISAGLAASILSLDYEPLRSDFDPQVHCPPKNNTLYDFWIRLCTAEEFLNNEDLRDYRPKRRRKSCFSCCRKNSNDSENLEKPPVVRSIFSAYSMHMLLLTSIMEQTVECAPQRFAKDLILTLPTTNLSGVPYVAKQANSSKENLVVYSHADYMKFNVNSEALVKEAYPLDLSESRSSTQWKRLIDSMAATSAYPGLLAPVPLSNSKSFYDSRYPESPIWNDSSDPEIEFQGVDGFLCSKPYDIAEMSMRRCSPENNPDLCGDPSSSWGSVILIDAFPPKPRVIERKEMGLPEILKETWLATKAHAGFKHELVTRAQNPDDLSTFLIAPNPCEPDLAGRPVLNSASLAHEGLRIYDFMRGRRDAQRFLKQVFVLRPEDAVKNPIFKGAKVDDDGLVRIIPLFGSASLECIDPERPTICKEDIENLQKLITVRIKRVIDVSVDNYGLYKTAGFWRVSSKLQNVIARTCVKALTSNIKKKSSEIIQTELAQFTHECKQ